MNVLSTAIPEPVSARIDRRRNTVGGTGHALSAIRA
jgi:hypothetical protein